MSEAAKTKYTLAGQVYYDDKFYAVGDEIELTEEEAAMLPVEEPDTPVDEQSSSQSAEPLKPAVSSPKKVTKKEEATSVEKDKAVGPAGTPAPENKPGNE